MQKDEFLLISTRGFLYSFHHITGWLRTPHLNDTINIVRDKISSQRQGVFDRLTRQVIVQLTIKPKVGKKIIGYYFLIF